jgi:hypothetical protein
MIVAVLRCSGFHFALIVDSLHAYLCYAKVVGSNPTRTTLAFSFRFVSFHSFCARQVAIS